MKKITTIICSFSCFACMHAQIITPDVIASGGGFYIGSGFSNSFTVGQGSLPETFTGGTFILTQGFQQPFDFPTGIASHENSAATSTYPNPSNGEFNLEYDLTANSSVHIDVYDVVGQIVFTDNSERSSGHQVQAIDLNDQPSGVYFIRCTINSNGNVYTLTQKITISR